VKKFYSPETADKRIIYAKRELEKEGYTFTKKQENADFILLGVNPDEKHLNTNKPVFAGNVQQKSNIFDYTKNEAFSIKNAYLTAEGAIALAVNESKKSLINSPVLIIGYGRIGKALKRLLEPFSRDITVCVRNEDAAALAMSKGAKVIGFDELKNCGRYRFIFNTVPHPVMNEKELISVNINTLLIDLASFPGGVDNHYAKKLGIKLIIARGLPGKYSPESAGKIVAETVKSIIKEKGL
jgi:dipicolinate synthase subunit A